MRFLSIVCLVSLLLSMAIVHNTQAKAYTTQCISTVIPPTVSGTPIVPPTDRPSVILNEILPYPHSGWNCAYQDNPGALQNVWIELYNFLDQPLDLYAARACIDSGPDTSQDYCLTIGSTIPAHGFFTFFPYSPNNYSLPSGFPTLRLLLNYTPVDQVNVPTLPNDVSYARVPDGVGKWQADTQPTINSSNSIALSPSATPTHPPVKQSAKAKTTGQSKKKTTARSGNADTTVQDVTANPRSSRQQTGGKSPQWQALQFPPSLTSPSAISTTQNVVSAPNLSAAPDGNVPQNILFSLFGVTALLSLWWGWRRFFKKRQWRK